MAKVSGETRNTDAYEAPELKEFGTISEWTKGARAQLIDISIIL
jgi:hypothetical protein